MLEGSASRGGVSQPGGQPACVGQPVGGGGGGGVSSSQEGSVSQGGGGGWGGVLHDDAARLRRERAELSVKSDLSLFPSDEEEGLQTRSAEGTELLENSSSLKFYPIWTQNAGEGKTALP